MGLAQHSPPLPSSPELAALAFTEALGAGDLEAATACLARDACLITPGATAIHGREEIRPLLAQMIDRGSRVEIVFSTVLRAGEVAFARQRWRVSSGHEGNTHVQDLSPTLVLRRLEGGWKLAIVLPWE